MPAKLRVLILLLCNPIGK